MFYCQFLLHFFPIQTLVLFNRLFNNEENLQFFQEESPKSGVNKEQKCCLFVCLCSDLPTSPQNKVCLVYVWIKMFLNL